jgi:hypothetical protein
MKILHYSFSLLIIVSLSILSCKKKKDATPAPTTGIVSGKITDATSGSALSGARIMLFNADNNSPVASNVSDVGGNYKFELNPGNYYIKIYGQGYESVPLSDAGILPFGLAAGQNIIKNYPLNALANSSSLGYISGKVTSGAAGLGGALVVADNGSTAYSGLSSTDGSYFIFNIPAGNWNLNAWKQNYTGSTVSATINAGQQTAGQDINMTSGASGSVTGKVTFLATSGIEVDVALVNPITLEAIPGLAVKTANFSYTITGVPAGTYLARASYNNDNIVMDPDWILKFGQPSVTVANSAVALNFSVTNALQLTSPTNDLSSTQPVVASSTPAFTWLAYASTDDYVIEVINASGKVIWGGISGTGNNAVRKVYVPKSQLSAVYNFDNSASEPLKSGEIYRWRIYASKVDNSTLGWRLISSSEDQRGLIKIQ